MESLFWADLAFFQILFFFFMYSLLDGFDLGIGVLLLFIRDKQKMNRLTGHIAPFWDGNEVWLVMGAGLLFAAFPVVFGYLLSSFYLPLMLTVGAYILRAVTLEFSYHDAARKQTWLTLFGLSSLAVSFSGLFVLGTLAVGLPMTGPGTLNPDFRNYVVTFPFVFAVVGVFITVWHGYAYAAKGGILEAGEKPGSRRLGFILSSLCIGSLWVMVGFRLYPNLLIAAGNPEWSISIQQAAAPASTLKILVPFCMVMTLFILGYTRFVYHVMRRKNQTL